MKVISLTSGRKLESDSYSYFSCLCSVSSQCSSSGQNQLYNRKIMSD